MNSSQGKVPSGNGGDFFHGRVLSPPVSLHPCVRRALTHLAAADPPEQLNALARACGVSPAYLSRLFARQMGQPLTQYRNALRLGRFWAFMGGPARPTLTEAVYAAGFGSYAQFYKIFRLSYGTCPRESLRSTARVRPSPHEKRP